MASSREGENRLKDYIGVTNEKSVKPMERGFSGRCARGMKGKLVSATVSGEALELLTL